MGVFIVLHRMISEFQKGKKCCVSQLFKDYLLNHFENTENIHIFSYFAVSERKLHLALWMFFPVIHQK